MGLAGGVAGAAWQVAALSVLPAVLAWVVVRDRRGRTASGRAARTGPAAGSGARRPLQDLAADLRVLAHAVRTPDRDTTPAAREATVLAYDDALVEVCAMLEVSEDLHGARRRGDALHERERVEAALEAAGLELRR